VTPRPPPTAKGLARRKTGVDGEVKAGEWYAVRGYELIERNWRCSDGEIDLIMHRESTVVFCEVKTRSSDRFGTALEAVTVSKQRRLRKLGARWLAEHRSYGRVAVRFDVASVMAGDITVIENAF
jgi:putative endonuclease